MEIKDPSEGNPIPNRVGGQLTDSPEEKKKISQNLSKKKMMMCMINLQNLSKKKKLVRASMEKKKKLVAGCSKEKRIEAEEDIEFS